LQFTVEAVKCRNNIVEYKAILLVLCKLRAMGVHHCTLKTDSKVIASQIKKECMARDKTLGTYLAAVRMMQNFFKGFIVEHIERVKNTEAEELAKAATKKNDRRPLCKNN
jgi:ribonuclease HI